MHLMDNYTRYEVFTLYKEDMLESNEQFASYSHFSRLWKNFFNNVKIPKKVRMGVCSACANLKSRRQRATNSNEQGTRLLSNHLKFHSLRHFEFRVFDNNFMFLHADETNRALKHHREQ